MRRWLWELYDDADKLKISAQNTVQLIPNGGESHSTLHTKAKIYEYKPAFTQFKATTILSKTSAPRICFGLLAFI